MYVKFSKINFKNIWEFKKSICFLKNKRIYLKRKLISLFIRQFFNPFVNNFSELFLRKINFLRFLIYISSICIEDFCCMVKYCNFNRIKLATITNNKDHKVPLERHISHLQSYWWRLINFSQASLNLRNSVTFFIYITFKPVIYVTKKLHNNS